MLPWFMFKHAPNPIPVLQDALKYHRDEIASHERAIRRLEVAMAALSAPDPSSATSTGSLPKATPIIGPVENPPLPSKTTKGELVEEMIRDQGFAGIAALVIRNKAKAQGAKIAPNFPYRQLAKLVTGGKVWKDKNGLYRATEFKIVPDISAQEAVTH